MHSYTQWALIADAQHARILQRLNEAAPWSELAGEAVEIDNPPSHEQGSERPGRVGESASTTRHAIEPRTDPHRAAKEAFAQRLAEHLEEAASAGRYASLLLVAPPAFLGDLRDALGAETRKRLKASLNKDLTKMALHDLVPHLTEA